MAQEPIEQLVEQWWSAHKRRRALEVGVEMLGWGVLLAATSWILLLLGVSQTLVLVLTAICGTLWCAWGVRQWTHRCVDRDTLVMKVDQFSNTQSLITTALAVERGEANGDEELAEIVSAKASTTLPSLDLTGFDATVFSWRPLLVGAASLGVLALLNAPQVKPHVEGVVKRLTQPNPAGPSAVAQNPEDKADEKKDATREDPPLSEQARERLERDAEALEALSKNSSMLSKESKESLEEAARQLRDAAKEDASAREALSKMARAKRNLKELKEKADKGEHIDEEIIKSLPDSDLAKKIAEAFKNKDKQELGKLSKELAERLAEDGEKGELFKESKDGSGEKMLAESKDRREALARALEEALKKQKDGALAQKDGSESGDSSDKKSGEEGAEGKEGEKSRLKRKSSKGSAGDASTSNTAEASARQLAQLLRDDEDQDAAKDKLEQLARDGEQQGERSKFSKSLEERMRELEREKSEQMKRAQAARGQGKTPPPCTSDDPEDCKSQQMQGSMADRGKAGQSGQQGEGQQGEGQQGEGEGQGQGEGEGRGQGEGQGEGQGQGQGSGKHPAAGGSGKSAGQGFTRGGTPSASAGGGKGDRSKRDGMSKDASASSQDWVKSQWGKDGGKTIMRTIKSVSRGERNTVGYRDVHESYEDIAEEKTKQEAIPLMRRDFIKDYFESIRPE